MIKNSFVFRKGLVIGIIMLFVGASVVPSISGNYESLKNFENNNFVINNKDSLCKNIKGNKIDIGNSDYKKLIDEKTNELEDQLDQYNHQTGFSSYNIFYTNQNKLSFCAQSFKPSFNTITRIRLYIMRHSITSDRCPLILSIRSHLDGNDLVSISKDHTAFNEYPNLDWVEFDIPDLSVEVYKTYYIIVRCECGEVQPNGFHYDLNAGDNTPYERGHLWVKFNSPTWERQTYQDCVFETYGMNQEPQDPFYFIHISDLHYGANGNRNRVKNKISWINQKIDLMGYEPAFVLITGDLLEYGNGWSLASTLLFLLLYEEESNNYNVLKQDLEGLNTPVYYCVPGNHDNYKFRQLNPWSCEGLNNYNYHFPDMYCPKSIVFPEYDLNLILLDTDCHVWTDNCYEPPRGYSIYGNDLNWLNDNIKPTTYKVIMMHNPVINNGFCHTGFPFFSCEDKCWDIGCIATGRTTFMNICDIHDVDLVLSGHTHYEKAYYRDNDDKDPYGVRNYKQPWDGGYFPPADTTETIYSTISETGMFRIIYQNPSNGQLEVYSAGNVPPFAKKGNSDSFIIPEVTGRLSGSFISLHLYDEHGNHVGLNETGGVDMEIENTTQNIIPIPEYAEEHNYDNGYFMWNHTIEKISNVPDDKSYSYQIISQADGYFNFSIKILNSNGTSVDAKYKNNIVTADSIGKINIDGENVDLMIYMDDDGDGNVDREIEPTMIFKSPEIPDKPDGPLIGEPGETYSFTTKTTDITNDKVYYLWDWGDDTTSDWIGPYNSGETAEASHFWYEKDTYLVRVRAKDEDDYGTDWSDPLTITISKNKNRIINTPFLNLLTNHPNLFPILQRLILRLGLQ